MREQLRQLGINVSVSYGEAKTTCPKCSADRKNSRDKCLSVNVTDGVWNCHNCGWKGTAKKKVEYIKPNVVKKPLSDNVYAYFKGRCIGVNTLDRYKVTQSDAPVSIMFNYYVDNQLVNVKYRTATKEFRMVAGAQLAPYGVDIALFQSKTEVLICEGEIDVLSFYEAGIKFAVSVPNGASKGSQKLEWLQDFYDIFEGKKIYLATDMDEAGISLRNELARRLGKQNCWVVDLIEKDANDVLTKHGSEALVECFNSATLFPVEGIDDANSMKAEVLRLYDNGIPKGCKVYDEEFSWSPGHVTLITGIPGHGKSTYVKNIMCLLAHKYGWKWLIYSAEEANTAYALADMYQIKSGKSFFYGDRISRDEVESLSPFMNEHFKYYNLAENDLTVDSILEKARHMVMTHGINGLVIDNMSTVEKSMSNQSDTRHNQIKAMMTEISRFARANDVAIIIVAHPRKVSKLNGAYEVPKGYDVGDSSHWYNLPDNGLTVYRNLETGQSEVHRWKVRFWYAGKIGMTPYDFDITNSRFTIGKILNDGSDKTKFVGQPINADKFAGLSDPF